MAKENLALFMVSLGCPKNLVDTEVIAGMALTNGLQLTMDAEVADIYLINTCAFLASAREESYAEIAEAIEWKKAGANRRIVIAGCLNEKVDVAELKSKFPEVDHWLRVDAMPKLMEILDGKPMPKCGGEPTYLGDETAPRLILTLPHVAYLKISDGCDNRCSYCSIPGIRGALRSRPQESVLIEARNLIEGGVKELVVIAQDITAYGSDRPNDGDSIDKLIRALNDIEGNFRIRLLYTHPAHYSEEFILAMAECSKVIPYLDIPLQHINDRILKAMGRKTVRKDVESLLAKMRSMIPNLVVRTTFIVGFPGESEEEFAELKEFMQVQKFERCGVFAYSPEPNTPAEKLEAQVPSDVAEARAKELMLMQEELMFQLHKGAIGREDRVLIDEVNGNQAIARGTFDAPDIDNYTVVTHARGLKVGDFCDIVITDAEPFLLVGKPKSIESRNVQKRKRKKR